ncbi:MAG TPA: cytidylyltransferase, partial [Ruminococcaceae bacterium]|nr:cytidylyltransferase [Oscillospiraceae bacterium]
NDCAQLHRLNALARDAVLGALMRGGVDIPCAEGVVIGPDVTFGRDCCVLPGTILRGHTSVGQGCVLGPGTVLDGCEVGDGARLDAVRGAGVRVAPGARPAPFTVLR